MQEKGKANRPNVQLTDQPTNDDSEFVAPTSATETATANATAVESEPPSEVAAANAMAGAADVYKSPIDPRDFAPLEPGKKVYIFSKPQDSPHEYAADIPLKHALAEGFIDGFCCDGNQDSASVHGRKGYWCEAGQISKLNKLHPFIAELTLTRIYEKAHAELLKVHNKAIKYAIQANPPLKEIAGNCKHDVASLKDKDPEVWIPREYLRLAPSDNSKVEDGSPTVSLSPLPAVNDAVDEDGEAALEFEELPERKKKKPAKGGVVTRRASLDA